MNQIAFSVQFRFFSLIFPIRQGKPAPDSIREPLTPSAGEAG